MRKTKTKLTEEKRDDEILQCVTWPELGKGRNRRFFKSKAEAKTFLQQNLVEQQNYGTAGMAFTERQRAEHLAAAAGTHWIRNRAGLYHLPSEAGRTEEGGERR